jgi:hypothetical protein
MPQAMWIFMCIKRRYAFLRFTPIHHNERGDIKDKRIEEN